MVEQTQTVSTSPHQESERERARAESESAPESDRESEPDRESAPDRESEPDRESDRESAPDRELAGIRLEANRVEVRLTRAAVKARLFTRPRAATRVGRFVVLERVGMGGMGIVYAAYDPQLDRRIALKVMRDDMVRARRHRQQRLLLREARAMAKVSHPNVVSVYDAGTVDGQVFVAMEFIEGTTLRAWLQQSPSIAQRLSVLTEAGRGLATAHAAGLVHRDFKPENVLVPDQGSIRVTDFGLARAIDRLDRESSSAASSTCGRVDGELSLPHAGTPAYMSPEQLRGEVVDARSDQWAFCVALFEALADERPFDRDDLTAMARGEERPAPPLPETVDVSDTIRAAIARGLAPEPEDRFADMDALLATLAPSRRSGVPWGAVFVGGSVLLATVLGLARSDEPTCPRATARLAGVWDEPARVRTRDALEAASEALGPQTWRRVEPLLDAHVTRWLDLRQSSCRSAKDGELSAELLDLRMACLDARHGELTALLDTLADADADVVTHAVESTLRLTPLDPCTDPRILRELSPPQPTAALREDVVALRSQIEHARALRRAGKVAMGLARVQPVIADAEALGDPGVIIDARLERGRTRAELADWDGAREDFDAVIERAGQLRYLGAVAEASVAMVDLVGVGQARVDAGLDLARLASIAVALGGESALLRAHLQLAEGRVLYIAGRSDEGMAVTQRGLDTLGGELADERARLEQASALRLIAKFALARGDLARASEQAQRALTIFEQLLGPDHPEVATTLTHTAAAALRAGNLGDAQAQFERAAEIQRRVYGEQHPVYGRTVVNLGSVMRASGQLVPALSTYRRATEILESSLGASDLRVAQGWINIGGVEAELDHLEAAQDAYARGIEGLSASVGEEHPQFALALANVGRLELRRGELEDARVTLGRALAIREQQLGPDHLDTARTRHSLGEVLAAAGDDTGAIAAYRAALPVMLSAHAPKVESAGLRAELGRALWRQGERTEARALFEAARPSLSATDRDRLDVWCKDRCDR